MPIVSVRKDRLCAALGKPDLSDDDFQAICFAFGLELDEVTTVGELEGGQEETKDGGGGVEDADAIVWKVEIAANRYDLLCLEGLARSLRIFAGEEEVPLFKTTAPPAMLRMTVAKETGLIRPFVVAAVLRGVTFNKARYDSFIALQDKLHQNICRRRTLVAIGTHDLSTLEPPFTYEALPPSDIAFVPLTQTETFTADKLLDFYDTDPSVKHIKPYVPIIKDSPVYPVIYDSKRVVLSLPPIINGDHSKITLETKDVFIECTATDRNKANIVLNQVVTMFSEYCEEKFAVEPVEIVYAADGSTEVTPHLAPRAARCRVEELNDLLGIDLEPPQIAEYLRKMQLQATYNPDMNCMEVQVPPTRADVLQECDVIEDVAIAYGYNKIPRKLPKTSTVGTQQPINHFSDLLRHEVAHAGYNEVLTMGLCSFQENFEAMRLEDDGTTAVVLENPKTKDFQIARTALLPGLLKTLEGNRSAKIGTGLKLFEISDVVVLDSDTDVGARNIRHMSAVVMANKSVFEVVHGLVDRVMQLCGVRPPPHIEAMSGIEPKDSDSDETVARYRLVESDCRTYLDGFGADIMLTRPVKNDADGSIKVETVRLGRLGVIHPEVVSNFGLLLPVTAMEIDLSLLL